MTERIEIDGHVIDWKLPRDVPAGVGFEPPLTGKPLLDEAPFAVKGRAVLKEARDGARRAFDDARNIHGDVSATVPARHLRSAERVSKILQPIIKSVAATLVEYQNHFARLEKSSSPSEPSATDLLLANETAAACRSMDGSNRRKFLESAIRAGDPRIAYVLFKHFPQTSGLQPDEYQAMQLQYRHNRWPEEMALLGELDRMDEWMRSSHKLLHNWEVSLYSPVVVEFTKKRRVAADAAA